MKKLIAVILAGALIWAGVNFYNSKQEEKERKEKQAAQQTKEVLPQPGFKAPKITLKGLDGKLHSLNDAKGKPYIINFWASWCGPCEMEAPDLVRLYDKYKGDIEIFAVNATIGDPVQEAQAFSERFGFEFPVLLDLDGVAGIDYKVISLPTTFFVDKDGIIVDQARGVLPPDQLEKKFKQLIEK
ncbi:TlpA disulfide reductase family protein [Bacillus sp. DX4.1]|uniref:TlpA family protein disulfide reductase n=1 Tax=Bacillus sp. DX4.1 TaxID=3055867 RepID=UPI0025A22D43|nr:TlpA disulfide reductase family protein [Bacillus sp. DX4.1]MDM5188034.1 TlpA disulfide reductase family protein [Bacillus sp. DX4.1]